MAPWEVYNGKMNKVNQEIRDNILLAALPNAPFDGWTQSMVEDAAIEAGYKREMVLSVFPRGVVDVAVHLSDWADREMLKHLALHDPKSLKMRERIALAVRTRLDVLAPYKEAERLALALWARPFRKFEGMKLVWKTADVIWDWAGDTATDYNRYTKRTLLCGVITSTTLFWLGDTSANAVDTTGFLDRRIDNVLSIGKIVGRFKSA